MRGAQMPAVTRRAILLGALLPLAGCVPEPGLSEGGQRPLAWWLRGLAPGYHAAAGLGALYLGLAPQESSADWLSQALFDVDPSQPFDRAGFEALMQRAIASRARDFLDDELVILDGWAVARTEARLLALIALCDDA